MHGGGGTDVILSDSMTHLCNAENAKHGYFGADTILTNRQKNCRFLFCFLFVSFPSNSVK